MRKFSMSILLLMLCLSVSNANSQGYVHRANTADDARQLIRNFEADQTLQPAQTGTSVPLPSGSFRYEHQIGDYKYGVWNDTRAYIHRLDISFFHKDTFYGQPYDTNVLAAQAMTQVAAQAVAQSFVQAYFADPQWLNKIAAKPVWDTPPTPADAVFIKSYEFTFTQDCGNGVIGPSKCRVEVDSVLGKVVNYSAWHYPVLISPNPNLTPNQAIACLLNFVHASDVQSVVVPMDEPPFVSSPDVMGVERLLYSIVFTGTVRGQYGFYHGYVDAKTGESNGCSRVLLHQDPPPKAPTSAAILALCAAFSRPVAAVQTPLSATMNAHPAGLSLPLLLVDGQPYLYVGYLCYGAKDVKLKYNGRDDIAIVSPERAARFSLHKAAYTLDGKTYALPVRPMIVQDRCYVPLCAAQQMMPFRIAYDAARKQVRFDALPVAAKTAGANAPKEEDVVFGGKR